MHLCPRELDKLVLHGAGFVAQKRLARGLRLNVPEAVALLATQLLEFIRDGKGVAELMDLGRRILGRRQVLPGVADLLPEVQVEGTFPDGTKLVTVHDPIALDDGDLSLALYGSFLPAPDLSLFEKKASSEKDPAPGKVECSEGDIAINEGRETVVLSVTSICDRPIQVGSHYHFVEVNKQLRFDRRKAIGMRLNIAAGTAVRFEPGETKLVSLCTIAGNQIVKGGNNLCAGIANIFSDEAKQTIMQRVQLGNFAHEEEEGRGEQVKRLKSDPELKVVKIPRHVYASMYGPTVGDKVRLGDTSLSIVIERDFTVYGDECKFGGGKVLREGMGQMAGISAPKVLDLVITNAIVVDYSGIFKCDIGIKDGLIAGLGKAGNPDVMAKVDPNMIVGPNTEVIAGETLIVTAGGIDTHVHFICPQLCEEALTNGLTTLLGGGFGPATGTKATTCTAAPFHIEMMLRATDEVPMNFGFTGKGNSSSPEGLVDIVEAGAVGLKLHEDWGTTPAAIDACLRVADDMDVQVTIHTDTLNESGNVEDSIAAFKGRTLHTYHSEGAGGGHAPDIITVCGEANVIPSSTNPTRPYTTNTIDEHLDMLMVCHHLSRNIAEDVAFAESRIRGETIAAEDVLHDIGAISIISSDSQAMGRIGEVVTRTWQTAHKMKLQRGSLPEDAARDGCDNFRVARYVAKYTINPAIAHGMSHLLGSVEVGKLADLCLYSPGMFGIRPEIILKGGVIAYSQMGDANASIPTPQPVIMRPMFGAQGSAAAASSIAFVSAIAAEQGVGGKYGLRKRVEPVKNCRSISKTDMKLNDALPTIKVDPETYSVDVTLGNENVNMKVPPISSLPLAQRYMLF